MSKNDKYVEKLCKKHENKNNETNKNDLKSEIVTFCNFISSLILNSRP